MGGFNTEWRNVSPEPTRPGDAERDPTRLVDGLSGVVLRERGYLTNLERLQGLLPSVAANSVLLIPPGDYYLDKNPSLPFGSWLNIFNEVATRGVRFPHNLLIRFAPGARLHVGRGVLVRVDGPLDAPLEQIFSIEDTELVDNSHAAHRIPPEERGRVVFMGDRVPELHPEWWGARSTLLDPSADSTAALEQCLRAARADRTDQAGNVRPVLPVVLQGRYRITRELVIDGADRAPWAPADAKSTAGAIVMGRRGPWSPEGRFSAALVADAETDSPAAAAWRLEADALGQGVSAGRAMLRLQNVVGAVIEGVVFEGNDTPSACVHATGENGYASVFRGCGFRGALDTLVQLGHFESAQSRPPPELIRIDRKGNRSLSTTDLSGTLFEGCDFAPARTATRVLGARAVVHTADNALPIAFERCIFRGEAQAMIHADAGMFALRRCAFDNRQRPDAKVAGLDADEALWDRPRGGVDIYLGNPNQFHQTFAQCSFHAVDVVSTSWQFLDTARVAAAIDGRVERSPVVLDGVRHGCVHATVRDEIPPAIEWFEPGHLRPAPADEEMLDPNLSALVGEQLTLIGCVFGVGVPAEHVVSPIASRVVTGPDTTLVTSIGSYVVRDGSPHPMILRRSLLLGAPFVGVTGASDGVGLRYLLMNAR